MPNQSIGSCWNRQPARVTLEGHPWVVGTERVGVEIELEGLQGVNRFRSDYWDVKGDGSLRNNGYEFVMRGPTGGVDLRNAVVEIDSFLNGKNPDGNWRCSTHVHVDVREMNAQQLKHMILIYTVLEKLLFRLSGSHRYKNNFCCALGFAQQQLKVLSRAWTQESTYEFTNRLVNGWDKYSAINLLPMTNFGSVEFRIAEAKWSKGKLMLLCNRFLAIKELAKSWQGTEDELIEHIVNSDIREILPKGIGKKVPEGIQEDLMVGYKLAYDLITFARNHPPVRFGERNDAAAAAAEWHAAADIQRTVPFELFVESDSPRMEGLSQGVWDQIVENFRHREYRLTQGIFENLNAATYRWIINIGGWNPSVMFGPETPQEVRDMYREWADLNPINEAPRPRAAARPRRQAQPNGAGWFADGGANIDQVLRRRLDELAARPVPAPDDEVEAEDPF
ncbi:MAG: amidoligase family protein [Plesiomonas sp.]